MQEFFLIKSSLARIFLLVLRPPPQPPPPPSPDKFSNGPSLSSMRFKHPAGKALKQVTSKREGADRDCGF